MCSPSFSAFTLSLLASSPCVIKSASPPASMSHHKALHSLTIASLRNPWGNRLLGPNTLVVAHSITASITTSITSNLYDRKYDLNSMIFKEIHHIATHIAYGSMYIALPVIYLKRERDPIVCHSDVCATCDPTILMLIRSRPCHLPDIPPVWSNL